MEFVVLEEREVFTNRVGGAQCRVLVNKKYVCSWC
jgi:hypothetical protein